MKLLIQHRHLQGEIAGVITYINEIIEELEKREVEIKTISTRQDNILTWLKRIFWADVVHINSNDLAFVILCKLLNKKIVIKYHYCFYQSIHFQYEKMEFRQRIKAENKYTFPKANYPLKWKLHTGIKWARLGARLATALLVDRHTACSNFLGESCSFPWKVATLYNPIKIKYENQQKHLDILSNPYKFVFVGRLDKDKGVDILLKAAFILQNENRNFQILIIGDGPNANELKQIASDLGILNYVSFLGKLPNQEVIVKLQDALALIAPSRWQDPAPYVVMEASSTQTCSIVSKMGGLPEVAGPHSFFFENEDAQELATCMRYCLDHPDEVINRGWLSSQYATKNFSSTRAATQLLDICHELTSKETFITAKLNV